MKEYYLSVIDGTKKGLLAAMLRRFLEGLSFFYSAGIRLRRYCFDKGHAAARELPVPVVSVGNLTWGGTGKTPLVIELAKKVEAMGKKPLVLTRGYGNDEAKELMENLSPIPVGVGTDRVKTAWKYLTKGKYDIVICDDAFQHWKIDRDWDILAVNAFEPFGTGFLIPRGNLREPLEAFRRAQTVVLTHSDKHLGDVARVKKALLEIAPHLEIAEACHEPMHFYRTVAGEIKPLEFFGHIRAVVFAGIGCPDAFRRTLEGLGIRIAKFFQFPDHHPFTREEIIEVRDFLFKENLQDAITTEKDYFRSKKILVDILDPWVLKMRMKIKVGERKIEDRLAELMKAGKLKFLD